MWETVTSAWNSALLTPLHEPVTLAIPAFVLFLAIEWFAARHLEDATFDPDGRSRPVRGATSAETRGRACRWAPCPS